VKSFYFLVFFCLYSISVVQGQHIKFEHYNDSDGLSHNSVRHIVQDKNGFLWLGTFSGLNRFDGYSFKSYTTTTQEKGVNIDDVTALELDESTNKLWIGTRNGLTVLKLDTHVFKTYLPEENNTNSLPDQEIRSVYVDKFKRVWVGTKDTGLYLFYPDEERFEKVVIEGFKYVKEIFEDKKGNIWIGSYDSGSIAKIKLDALGRVSDITTFLLSIPNSNRINPYVNFIYEDFKSDIFVGTRDGGLYKLDVKTNTFKNIYIKDNAIRESLGPYFLSVARAPDGKYWLGTIGGLIVCDAFEDIEKGNFEWHRAVITEESSLVDNLVYALHFDPSGVLWIGTEDGFDKYDPFENQFRNNNDISIHIDNHVPRIKGFAKTYDSKVIVATANNGLFISDNDKFSPLFDALYDVASIYSEDGKIFYCGLQNGKILVYNYQNSNSKIVSTSIEDKPILTINSYGDNEIIIGSSGGGIAVIDKNTFKIVIPSGTLLPKFYVFKIIKGGNGDFWIATSQGAVKYNIKLQSIKLYERKANVKNGLPHNNVSDILIDSENTIWAATRKGMAKYDAVNDAFKVASEFEDIKGVWVTNMIRGIGDNFWLNLNNNKIAKYNVKLDKLNVYYVNSGNRLDIFSSSGFYNFNNSKIYLGGKNGVIYFSPNDLEENKWSPAPVLTRFKIDNNFIEAGTEINGQIPLKLDLNYKKYFELNYNNRNFLVQFSAPSYSNQKLNRFRYMLEGVEKNWIEVNSISRTIQYSNLSPNDYVLKIKARNSDGVWSDTVSYQIKVLPPFWLSIWGISLISILLAVLVYFVNKQLRYRRQLKNALLEEKIKRERDEKLNNEKLRFFTNISHELRTPLTLILGPVKQLLESNTNSHERSRINLINQNANRLLRLVNQILDFRRAETGVIKLKVVKAELVIPTENVFYSFSELAESKHINFNLDIESEVKDCWIDLEKYNKILYNLLSNAMKFTQNDGNINLFVGIEEGNQRTLIIEVSDNGIGIPKESQEKIFSRFYQASNSKEITTGTGIGLSLVKALVEIHKGEITVESTPKFGSIFTVRLPIYKEYFQKSEIFEFEPEPIEEVREVWIKKVKNNIDIKHKILIIEDNLELRKYLVDFLSDYYKVYEAENGKEGLEICRKVKPILCVVDVMTPIMDGFEYVEEVKKDEDISHTAIILLTALAENENRIKGYSLGVDGYLVKPFDPFLLKTRIENIIKIHSDLKQNFSGEVESDVSTLGHSQIDIDFISKVKDVIEGSVSNPELTDKYLCHEMGMSSSKLYRKIKQLTDLTPKEFTRTVRLKKSVQLLKTKEYNVSEIANMVGFNDPLYFSKCFKTQFGDSPSKYLK
jgi:signal transduction histidine kinase/ligand-binding sensor domain-containing protein/DNA-binding response OmpR family regulator